ncbi:hypothetical protein MVEN_00084000 [Mycena venus]|uniref:Uncharacterized protein n=1 Tax=Mycena venus TaxID=2733690 RepID=A0A8H6ZAN9_9AGAR|nr:hypothetical protein MVEN_00084000 [Mycena venus]
MRKKYWITCWEIAWPSIFDFGDPILDEVKEVMPRVPRHPSWDHDTYHTSATITNLATQYGESPRTTTVSYLPPPDADYGEFLPFLQTIPWRLMISLLYANCRLKYRSHWLLLYSSCQALH